MPFWKRSKRDSTPKGGQSNIAGRTSAQPNPGAENPFRSRGDELFNEGDYANAAFMYSEAATADGGRDNKARAPLYVQLALAQVMCSPPQLDKALSNVNTSTLLDPSAGNAWKLKGDILDRTGDYHGAAAALAHAVSILPTSERVQAQQALASVRMKMGSAASSSTAAPPTFTYTPAAVPQPSQPPNVTPTTRFQPVRPNPPHTAARTSLFSTATIPNRRPVPSPAPSARGLGVGSPSSPLSPPSPIPRASTPNATFQSQMLADELNIPTEAPPSYSTSTMGAPRTGLGGAFSESQFAEWNRALNRNRQGALYLRPFTAAGRVDSICCLLWGKTYVESVLFDITPQTAGHRSWKEYHASTIIHPGTNFLDYDCETAASYDGHHKGTTSVLGYSEEYREFQLSQTVQFQLSLEEQNPPPPMTLDAVVERLQLLQRNATHEDNARLRQIIGLPASLAVTTRIAIEDICLTFHRGQRVEPTRFIDFLTTASFMSHVFGGAGIGLTNFLLHILLGAELALRQAKLGPQQKYPDVMKTTTSALVVVARQWMENVTIRKGLDGKHVLTAMNHATQTEGLLRFAEAIGWPYMDEARQNIEGLYAKLSAQPAEVHNYLKDWLYGLVLPGKFFRQRLLSCLVLACPSTKHLSFAPNYSSGLVVGNKSYWPKRSILGRVLGGMSNMQSTCGWVGPVPGPAKTEPGWILLHARVVNFIRPVVDNLAETSLELLGFSEAEMSRDPVGLTTELLDISKWRPPAGLPRRPGAQGPGVTLQEIRLNSVESTSDTDRRHRASLDLMCHGAKVTFTLYSNPLFVHVPRCQGASHPIHEKLAQRWFSGIVPAKDLKSGAPIPSSETLLIIDATRPNEDVVARAWCAETGRHAVVRKAGVGCFACATNLATKRTGLGFNVLIWCE